MCTFHRYPHAVTLPERLPLDAVMCTRHTPAMLLDCRPRLPEEPPVSFIIDCPNCGPRPSTDFRYGGETRPVEDPSSSELDEIKRLWMRRNVAGDQTERWFHRDGCRRWLTITRNTVTNQVLHG